MTPRWCRAPQALSRRLPDGIMVCGPGRQEPISLLGSGAELWAALAEPVTVTQLATRLAARYGAEPAQIVIDIEPTLRELQDRHLIVPADPDPR